MARKTTKKTTAKKTTKKTARKLPAARRKREKTPAPQGTPEGKEYEVGYGKPPTEHQWKPGQSGNPRGAPKARTNLWPTLCRMMALDDKQLRALQRRRKELKLVELIAIKITMQLREGVPRRGIALIVKQIIERDEGKPIQELHVETPESLSDDDCEKVRQLFRQRGM